MAENLDLLGDPIPENWGKRGRPAHIPTVGNRNKIMVLLALGWDEPKIAGAIGITRPTLRKHYFRELKVRDEARARLEGSAVVAQAAKAVAGDTQAFRELQRLFGKADLAAAQAAYPKGEAPVAEGQARPKGAAVPRVGVKEQRRQAAREVSGVYATPAPPKLIN